MDRNRWRINSQWEDKRPGKCNTEIKMLFENAGCQSRPRSTLLAEMTRDTDAHAHGYTNTQLTSNSQAKDIRFEVHDT